MIRSAFARWPWATSLLLALPLMAFLIMGATGGGTLVFPPLWLVFCAAMTPAVGIANFATSLRQPHEDQAIPDPAP